MNKEDNWKPEIKKKNKIQTVVKRMGLDEGFRSSKFGKKRKPIVEYALGLKDMKIKGEQRLLWFSPSYVENKFLLILLVGVNGEEEVKKELGITGFTDDFLRDANYVRENEDSFFIKEYRERLEGTKQSKITKD